MAFHPAIVTLLSLVTCPLSSIVLVPSASKSVFPFLSKILIDLAVISIASIYLAVSLFVTNSPAISVQIAFPSPLKPEHCFKLPVSYAAVFSLMLISLILSGVILTI